MQKSQVLVYAAIIVYGLAIALLYRHFQPPNQYAENPLADANAYLKIAEYFNTDEAAYSVRHSYHQRVAVPWLATQLKCENTATAFFIINSIFAVITLPLMYYFLSYLQVKREYIAAVILYFSLHWVGPFRQNAIDPINVDMPVYVFEMLLILFMLKRKYVWLLPVVPFVVAVKEVSLAFLVVNFLAVAAIRIFLKERTLSFAWAFLLLLAGIFTFFLLNVQFPSPRTDITPIHIMAFQLREAFLNPDHFIRWGLGIFAAFGAFLFLDRPRLSMLFKVKAQDLYLLCFALSAFALSFLGGMDYTRLAFIGFPLVIAVILMRVKPGRITFIGAFILSVALTRFWTALPVIGKDLSSYNAWLPEYASFPWLIGWAFAAFFCAGLMAAIHFMEKRYFRVPPSGL